MYALELRTRNTVGSIIQALNATLLILMINSESITYR